MIRWALIRFAVKTGCVEYWDRFSHVGGSEGGGWILPVADVISLIENGEIRFYVDLPGQRARAVVGRTYDGHRYLKSVVDGDVPNTLMGLPTLGLAA